MITAEQAYKISHDMQLFSIDHIYEQIRLAASKGQFKTIVNIMVMESIQKQLEQEGYRVSFLPDSGRTVIDWWTPTP